MSTKKAVKKAVKKVAAKKAAAPKKAVAAKALASTEPKVANVTLKLVEQAGVKCVQRDNGKLAKGVKGKDVDIVRVTNTGEKGKIKVILDPAEGAKLFDPIPKTKVTLAPGESVDWIVKAIIVGSQAIRYGTDPSNCTGNDQNDIEIKQKP